MNARQSPRPEFAFESERWRTVRSERTILVVSRSLITTLWHMDFLDEVLADPRIQVVFTVEDEEPVVFSRGALDVSDAIDALRIPWSDALSRRFDLAISASYRGSLHRLDAPLLVGPHGAGLVKTDSLSSDGLFPVPRQHRAGSQIAATTVAVAHRFQARALATEQAEVEVAVVGDPCLDRLVASKPHRELYRKALGLRNQQRLVIACSTWGPDSLLAITPDIGQRLACELPADRYRVALVVHPHVWTSHGIWQVNAWTKRAREAGVLALTPFQNAWRPALIASDAVIHDHGSIALYAAALDKPLLAAPSALSPVRPDSEYAELVSLVPKLDPTAPLEEQVDSVIAAGPSPSYRAVGDLVGEHTGASLSLHRDLIYRLINLAPPPFEPRTLAMPAPDEPLPTMYSHHVVTTGGSRRRVSVRRIPLLPPPPPPGGHLIADVREPDPRVVHNAAIIVDTTGLHTAAELFDRYPGCVYAVLDVTRDAAVLAHRHGGHIRLSSSSPDHDVDPCIFASAYLALASAGQRLSAGDTCAVELGQSAARFSVHDHELN